MNKNCYTSYTQQLYLVEFHDLSTSSRSYQIILLKEDTLLPLSVCIRYCCIIPHTGVEQRTTSTTQRTKRTQKKKKRGFRDIALAVGIGYVAVLGCVLLSVVLRKLERSRP